MRLACHERAPGNGAFSHDARPSRLRMRHRSPDSECTHGRHLETKGPLYPPPRSSSAASASSLSANSVSSRWSALLVIPAASLRARAACSRSLAAVIGGLSAFEPPRGIYSLAVG